MIPADEKVFEDEKETIRDQVTQSKQMKVLDDWFRQKAPRVDLKKDLKKL